MFDQCNIKLCRKSFDRCLTDQMVNDLMLLITYNGIYSQIIKCKLHLLKIGDFDLRSVLVKNYDKIQPIQAIVRLLFYIYNICSNHFLKLLLRYELHTPIMQDVTPNIFNKFNFILNNEMVKFNQIKGVMPSIEQSRFANQFRPILFLMLFKVIKVSCLDVKI